MAGKRVIGLILAVLFVAALAWAKIAQSRRVYRALWVAAAGTVLLAGLVL